MKTYACMITEENYDIVAAFLPPEFTQVPRKTVFDDQSVLVINDFCVDVDADRNRTLVGENAWMSYSIFEEMFDIQYGECLPGFDLVVRR